jgi:hypothetical protein
MAATSTPWTVGAAGWLDGWLDGGGASALGRVS